MSPTVRVPISRLAALTSSTHSRAVAPDLSHSGWVWALAAAACVKILVSLGGVSAPSVSAPQLPPGIPAAHIAVFSLVGTWLMVVGRRDRRAIHLGVFFLLTATPFADHLLLDLAAAAPPWAPLAHLWAHVHVSAYLPFCFWLFVREFPRIRAGGWHERFLAWNLTAAFWLGTAVLASGLYAAFGPAGAVGEALDAWIGRYRGSSLFWPVLIGLGLPALPFAIARTRKAGPDERRRVRILVAGLTGGVLPVSVLTLLARIHPALEAYLGRPEGVRTLGLVVYPALLSIPVVTAYAVLVHRALDLQLVARKALRYLLARYTIAAASVAPFVVLLGLLYRERERSIAELWLDQSGWLAGGALMMGGVLMGRRTAILGALDRRFFREQYDAHRILQGLVEEIRFPRPRGELADVLCTEIQRALHVRFARVLFLDPGSGTLADARGVLPPLRLDASLVQRMEAAAHPLEVDWERPRSWLRSLPEGDAQWLADTEANLLVPVAGADAALLGVIVLGEKRSELPFSANDRSLLATIAGSVAMALESRLLQLRVADGGAPALVEPPLHARECLGCGRIAAPDARRCGSCGDSTVRAVVPLIVAGKFEVLQRIGSGGMGVVYRGVDLALQRPIAIKTLPRAAPEEVRRLRTEARAMAAVMHPGLALIFGLEAWVGIPMLIVEFLAGGTLEKRLAPGPLAFDEAIELGISLTPALARLHDAGILHRDIKPSNVGFSGDGTPKLLDFGLAHVLASGPWTEHAPDHGGASASPAGRSGVSSRSTGTAGVVAGTPLYLSPEAVTGQRPQVSFDLWAMCMMLYEAVAGRHPVAEGGHGPWALRITRDRIPDLREFVPDAPAALAEFFQSALSRDPQLRPRSAGELQRRLARLRAELSPHDLTVPRA